MNWLVFGAGAIGSVVGGLLARSGEAVWLVGRSWHLDLIRREGLRIRGILGDHSVTTCNAATDIRQLPRQRWDAVLVTVKSFDTPRVAAHLPGLLSEQTVVVSLQNGLGNWEALAQAVPAARIVGGRVIFGVELEAGVANVTVWGGDILLGGFSPEVPADRVQRICDALGKAGLRSSATGRIREALWGKVIYNCSLNPLSTLLDVPYGRLLDSEPTRRLMREIVAEAYAVAGREQVQLEPADPERYAEDLFGRLIPLTASHHPSMLQDLRRGRRTEIDSLNGAIERLGARHRVPTPVNGLLSQLIRAREALASAASRR